LARKADTADPISEAEWLCWTADQIDPPRVPGSYRRFWRSAQRWL